MCARPIAGFKRIFYFLFTAKSTFNHWFHSVIRVFSVSENVAHFFPLHSLHLDLTFLGVPFLLTISLSQGKLTTAVYRR